MYVPANPDLRCSILEQYHDAPTAGHPGILGTLIAVQKDYYWPGMHSFVRSYVSGCSVCQQFKINQRPMKLTLIPISTSSDAQPFTHLSMDFITGLPQSGPFNSILVVADHGLTKGVLLFPVDKEISATENRTDLFIRNFQTIWLTRQPHF